MVLFDGDAQGKDYQRSVANLCKAHDVKTLALEAGWAIEDYCLHPDLFLRAVEETLRSSFEAIDTAPPADLDKQVEASWKTFDNQLMRQGKKGADQKGELAEKTGRVGDIPIEEKNEQRGKLVQELEQSVHSTWRIFKGCARPQLRLSIARE